MIKFGIIGCGSIGARHAAVINAETDAENVAFCDIDISKTQELRENYGTKIPCFSDYKIMLNSCNAQIVVISTPNSLHAEMAIMAARAGKHILVEKPMALSTRDANNMMTEAMKNKVHLMVVKQNRFNVPVVQTKNAMDSGKLGKIFMVQCNVLWNRHDGYYKESKWRGKKNMEGGALFTQASHFIDLLNWWFGDVEDVQSVIATKNHDVEIEDCGTAMMQFKSGIMGSLTWTTCVYNKNYEGSITIIAENGTIKIGGAYLNRIDYWDVRALPLQEGLSFTDKPNTYDKYHGSSSNHDKVVKNIILKLLDKKSDVVDGEGGIMAIKTIEMIYKKAIKL